MSKIKKNSNGVKNSSSLAVKEAQMKAVKNAMEIQVTEYIEEVLGIEDVIVTDIDIEYGLVTVNVDTAEVQMDFCCKLFRFRTQDNYYITDAVLDDILTIEDNQKEIIDAMLKGLVHKCCICGKKFVGFGNLAYPVANGICCDECNSNVVLPARFNAQC